MPYKDVEKQKEYQNRYQQKYREANCIQLDAYHRKWVKDNPENVKQHQKKYTKKLREVNKSRGELVNTDVNVNCG